MGTTFYYIEAPGQPGEVLSWFRALPAPPEETPTPDGLVLYFRSLGALAYDDTGAIDATRSPIVTLFRPAIRRSVVWTVGEVHFRSTLQLAQNKAMQKVCRQFSNWLKGHEQVYNPMPGTNNRFGYYLEGGSKNQGPVFALPSGIAHLDRGGYCVSHGDNDLVLDTLCRALRLRGVECTPDQEQGKQDHA